MSDSVTITLDGRKVEAAPGEMLIAVADRAGVPIPRFCYHPKLSVAANCRMCLIEVAGAPAPLPACATPAADGMEVLTRSELAREAQRGTMEFLLINHPLDCPVCDQGGECELQDVALGYGAGVSRYAEARRAVPDPDLGPLVSTDMTRCIHCTRCVRFTEEIAGEQELGAFGRGEFLKIGTYVQSAMQSELSGCVIDLCPVGALNARPSRMQARAWEMEGRPGLGEHDGTGSHLSRHVLRGQQVRCVPRAEESINEGWLSDRDRFSYQAAAHPERLDRPLARHGKNWVPLSWGEALERAAAALGAAEAPVGLIHPSATLEECFRFQELLRGCGARTVEHRLRAMDFRGGAQYPRRPELGCAVRKLGKCDGIVLLGGFLRHDQPILNHRVRQAALGGTRVHAVNPCAFDWNFELAGEQVLSPREWLAWLEALERGRLPLSKELKGAKRPLLWLGPLALNHPDASLLYAAARRACAKLGARLGTLPEGANAPGAWLAGCVAHRGPGGASVDGMDLAAALEEAPRTWVLHGLDPDCDAGDPARLGRALARAGEVIGLQAFAPPPERSPCSLLLPIATVGERGGHLISLEGCWQRMAPAAPPPGEARDGAEALAELARQAGLAPAPEAALLERCREAGEAPEPEPFAAAGRIPPDGLLRVGAPSIYQQDAVVRRAHALQQTDLAQGLALRAHPATLAARGLEGATEARVSQDGAGIVLPLRPDPRMPTDCVYVPTGDARLAALGPAFGVVELGRV